MGNRATITTPNKDLALYVHWNGGRDSIEAFLEYCKLRGFRNPCNDCYGWARMCQVIANYMGKEGLSVGIMPYMEHSGKWCDNGEYVIDENWEIIDRIDYQGIEQDAYKLNEMLEDINLCQPEKQRLEIDFSRAERTEVGDLRIGDRVYMNVDEVFKLCAVIGFGDIWKTVGGCDVSAVPYTNAYTSSDCAEDLYNYIRTKTIWRVNTAEVKRN